MKILIVEDRKREMRKAINLAKQYGYSYNLVSTFQAADKMFSKRKYDGVITDKGFSVNRNLRGAMTAGYFIAVISVNRDIPCVICTGEKMDEMWQYTEEEAKNMGAPIFGNKNWQAAFEKLASLLRK